MANHFVDLPTTAGDGAGAWTDVSAMGGLKTITVTNTSDTPPFVTVECSNEDTPTAAGFTLPTFTQAKEQTFGVACHWMRAVTSNYRGGAAAVCSVGSTDDGTSSLELGAPASNGHGTPVDVSALLPYKTIQVIGRFGGTLLVSVSEDGGTTYGPAFSFQGGVPTMAQTLVIAADFMRVERVGAPGSGPTPLVWVSATTSPGGGGGGGGSGVAIQEDGTPVLTATTLNFTNTGVTVTDAGGGVAQIDIPGGGGGGGVNVLDADSTVVAAASGIRFLGAPVTVTVDGGDPTIADVTVTIPAASSFTVTLAADVGTGFIPGQVGYQDPALSHRFTPAFNDGVEASAQVVGMCTQAQVGSTQLVCIGGPVTLTAPQWATIIAEGGPLVEGIYYLAEAAPGSGGPAGSITAVKPTASGSYITVVGYAIRLNGAGSTLTFIVRPEAAVLIP